MTTRRQFFGLMAAAPIAAPVIAREMVAANQGGAIKNITSSFTVATGEQYRLYGPSIDLTRYSTGIRGFRFRDWADYAEDIPNRLYGAQVTASGDVV